MFYKKILCLLTLCASANFLCASSSIRAKLEQGSSQSFYYEEKLWENREKRSELDSSIGVKFTLRLDEIEGDQVKMSLFLNEIHQNSKMYDQSLLSSRTKVESTDPIVVIGDLKDVDSFKVISNQTVDTLYLDLQKHFFSSTHLKYFIEDELISLLFFYNDQDYLDYYLNAKITENDSHITICGKVEEQDEDTFWIGECRAVVEKENALHMVLYFSDKEYFQGKLTGHDEISLRYID